MYSGRLRRSHLRMEELPLGLEGNRAGRLVECSKSRGEEGRFSWKLGGMLRFDNSLKVHIE